MLFQDHSYFQNVNITHFNLFLFITVRHSTIILTAVNIKKEMESFILGPFLSRDPVFVSWVKSQQGHINRLF